MKLTVLTVRIDDSSQADIDSLVRQSKKMGFAVTRAEIVRRALRIGLASLLRRAPEGKRRG